MRSTALKTAVVAPMAMAAASSAVRAKRGVAAESSKRVAQVLKGVLDQGCSIQAAIRG